MLVHHVVILNEVLSDIEVVALHLGLGALYGLAHHGMLDRDVFVKLDSLQNALDAVAAETAHHVVLERHIEAGAPRVTLAPGASPQLIVDAPCLVTLGADNVQSTQPHHPAVLVLPPLSTLALGGAPQ